MIDAEPPPLITECPNCRTRFRVSESQLQMAHGRVRCGACLAVFPGVDHLLLGDDMAPPALNNSSTSTLEIVLAELAEEQSRGALKGTSQQPSKAEAAATPESRDKAQEGKRNAAADKEPDLSDLESDLLYSYNPIAKPADRVVQSETDADFEDALDETLEDIEGAAAHAVDWTAVQVDTDAMQTAAETESNKRPSIADALEDEEALRWWIADELPGAADAGSDPKPAKGSLAERLGSAAPAGADAEADDEGMIVQLSELDAVGSGDELDDDEFDIQEIIAASNNNSLEELEDLLNELPEEGEPISGAGALANRVFIKASPSAAQVAENAAARNPVSLIEAAIAHKATGATAGRSARGSANASGNSSGDVVGAEVVVPKVPALASVQPSETKAKKAKRDPQNADTGAAGGARSANMESAVAPAQNEDGSAATEAATFSVGRPLRLATAAAFILLAVQVLYFQFDSWSKTAAMRPVYAGICTILGCELPLRRSLADLQSQKLSVRAHPDKVNMLLVDALILNRAEFEQPFPIIEMHFMSLTQESIHTYSLTPAEYLGGELAALAADKVPAMAVRTPIHIDIELPDPGPEAVNYQLKFR
jgi:predicted Zn finger-like uncharacterized protein